MLYINFQKLFPKKKDVFKKQPCTKRLFFLLKEIEQEQNCNYKNVSFSFYNFTGLPLWPCI